MSDLKKILYAEDETDIQIIVQTIADALATFEIKICSNGKELLENAEDYCPDLILLDVMMPEMDGPTTFAELRKKPETKDIPVIFMTAKAQVHEVEEYIQKGALGLITKPFDPLKLCDSITEIWNNKPN